MRPAQRLLLALVILGASSVCWPQEAQAYLDPGTGSYLFQLLIAGVLAGLVTLKLTWRNVMAWLKGLGSHRPKQDDEGD